MPLDELELRVLNFVQDHLLIPPGSKVLVALSGGMDSVCLLSVLLNIRQKIGFEIAAAHLNHMIRPTAARDEEFVKQLCKEFNVELYVEKFDVLAFCKQEKVGIEEGARIVRYQFLEKVRKKSSSDLIALAHNLNDLVETMVHRVVRGTGLTGLVCMKSKDGAKIRPLLYTTREEIESYVHRKSLPYVEDETNYDLTYTRNYIRHKVIPLLKQMNPNLENTLKQLHFSSILLEKHVTRILENAKVVKLTDRMVFSIEGCDEFEIVEILKYCAESFGVCLAFRQIEDFLKSIGKTSFSLRVADDLWLKKGFEFVSVEKTKEIVSFLELSEFGVYNFNGWIFKLSDKVESKQWIELEKGKSFIRTRRPGDKIGKVKLKDLMIDSKIPEFLRNEYPIVCSNDKIIWIPYVYKSEEQKGCGIFLNLIFDPYECILKMENRERRKRFERR
ncbi:tRNA lysidine(34) synthetase TilS [Pseudothermotoga thermarum]|uniref:tRNA(Ile)-lysidine synthase n=1 Tax=Pseudothermotoga thermarum DSM 5069 TaxID=688269 RepID=F7YWK7_9THEM|nr:tRNA lysidine(34) synthetase TilS [Pseudothermotoga thermarum]AEH51988.1 tRNA(Ile)-lysidine synthetase [Pseudothermotoga thermarum DSM 5069]